jgi:hypothetical protein
MNPETNVSGTTGPSCGARKLAVGLGRLLLEDAFPSSFLMIPFPLFSKESEEDLISSFS